MKTVTEPRRLTPDQWRDMVEGKRSFIPWMVADDEGFVSPLHDPHPQKMWGFLDFCDLFHILNRPGLWQPWFPEWEGCPLKEGDRAIIMTPDGAPVVIEDIALFEIFIKVCGIIAYQVIPKEGE